jgi:hypothetical protein
MTWTGSFGKPQMATGNRDDSPTRTACVIGGGTTSTLSSVAVPGGSPQSPSLRRALNSASARQQASRTPSAWTVTQCRTPDASQ